MKATPIGQIPVEWKISHVGDHADFVTSGSRDWSRFVSEDGAIFVGMGELSRTSIRPRFSKARRILPPANAEGLRTRVKPGDLLISITADLGAIGVAPTNVEESYVSQHLALVRLQSHTIIPEFVGLFFASDVGQKQFARLGDAGAKTGLNLRRVRELLFPLPPRDEQQRIAEILMRWDTYEHRLGELLSVKRHVNAALTRQLLTGKRRFPRFGRSGGKVSKGWKTWHLGDLFDERVEAGRGELPLLSITADRGIVHRNELEKKDTSNADKSKYLRIAPGDIGYNTMRMWQGVSALSELEGIVSPAYTVCIPKADRIDGRFAAYLFKYPPIVHRFWRFSQGMVDDTLNLKFHNFAQVQVTIPPLDEQRRIASLFAACYAEIALLGKRLDAMGEQKKGLMQKLLTGKVRVKV